MARFLDLFLRRGSCSKSCVCFDSLQKDYKKQMLMAAHALAVDAKNLLDVIDQSRLKMINQTRPH